MADNSNDLDPGVKPQDDKSKKRTKFPSGGGVARSAGVVLRIRNDKKKTTSPLRGTPPQEENLPRFCCSPSSPLARGVPAGRGVVLWIVSLRSQ